MAIDRRKRPLVRDRGEWRDASLFIVATEGEKTEKIYLSCFHSQKIKVVTLECTDGRSSPEGVLDRIDAYKNKYQLGAGDTFWLLIDRDSWRTKMLSAVASECRRKEFSLLISNPMFEVWLAFHFDDDLPEKLTKRSLASHLRKVMGRFSKSDYPTHNLSIQAKVACEKARARDKDLNSLWPISPGSRAYRLLEEILART